jgi:uncharacterized delta-60 repeat protein
MKTLRFFSSLMLVSAALTVGMAQPGSRDVSFNAPAGLGRVASIALQADGKILAGGSSLARLNADGSRDASFNVGAGPNDAVSELLLQPDGRVLVAGNFTQINGVARPFIARLNPNGAVDTSFNPGGGPDAPVTALELQSDGRIIIGGSFTQMNGLTRYAVARLNRDGQVDPTFDASSFITRQPDPNVALIHDLLVRPDDRILVAGLFSSFSGANATNLARLNPDGSHDTGFVAEPTYDGVLALALQPDGKVVAAGTFWTPTLCLARFLPDGSLDDFFPHVASSADDPWLTAVALQRDGRILYGGHNLSVTEEGSPLRGYWLGRVQGDGAYDASFDSTTSVNDAPLAIVLQPDGKVLVGINGGILRLNNDLSPGALLDALIEQVGSANLGKRTRPLIASLNAAAASLEAEMVDAALSQLRAFQNKAQAQLGRSDPRLAAALIKAAQDIIDAALTP